MVVDFSRIMVTLHFRFNYVLHSIYCYKSTLLVHKEIFSFPVSLGKSVLYRMFLVDERYIYLV